MVERPSSERKRTETLILDSKEEKGLFFESSVPLWEKKSKRLPWADTYTTKVETRKLWNLMHLMQGSRTMGIVGVEDELSSLKTGISDLASKLESIQNGLVVCQNTLDEIKKQIESKPMTPAVAQPKELLTFMSALNELRVPFSIDEQALSLLTNKTTLQAATIVLTILAESISRGLRVEHITIDLLTDHDAGQWSEVVFHIQTNLNSKDANRAWDNVLANVSKMADGLSDTTLANSLLEQIGIHFTWVSK